MKAILERLYQHDTLSRAEAHDLLLGIADKMYNDAQVASLLTVYRMRDIRVDELLGFRDALIERALPIDLSEFAALDIVGTGGDGKNTFNISTCACFVVAAAGYKVAKHGNYGASSVSGASTVLEQHGIKFTNDTDKLKRSIDQCGMVYLHAPLFHPALAAVGPIRRAMKVKPSSTCSARWSTPHTLHINCSVWPICSKCGSTPTCCKNWHWLYGGDQS